MKKEAIKRQENVLSNKALMGKGPSQTTSTTTSVFHTQKQEKSGNKTVRDRQTNKLETVTEDGKSVKPVKSLRKHSEKVDKDKQGISKDDTVTVGPYKDFDYQDEGENFDKTSHTLYRESYNIKIPNKPEHFVEMAEITKIPKRATNGGTNEVNLCGLCL